jgi:hypothetical protein
VGDPTSATALTGKSYRYRDQTIHLDYTPS